MRTATAIILLISLLGTTFSPYCSLLDYALNKKYIAATLCENRDRPELKCEGKCYLCRKLNKENNKDSENTARHANFKFQLLSVVQAASFDFSLPHRIKAPLPFYQDLAGTSYSPSFFHPPQV